MNSNLSKKEENISVFEKISDHISDEELVSKFTNDNVYAFEKLASRLDKTITYFANLFNNDGNSFDDLYQEGLIALLRAAKLYDERFAKFSTFATLCIKRRMLTYLKSCAKLPATLSLDELCETEGESYAGYETPEQHFLSEDFLDNLSKEAKFHLSSFENKVFLLRAKNFSISDICAELSVDKKSVDNALFRIRKKLKNINF